MNDRIRVLLLEDDPLDRELIEARLLSEGLAVDTVSVDTKDDYVSALGDARLDLILSDYSLPAYDGMSALAEARARAPSVPFVFVSGAIGEDRALEALRQGAVDYVLKSRLDRLGPAVRRVLRELGERRDKERAEAERDRLLANERELRVAAEAANRMKDEFLALVSHELRTPLNAILGWTRILQMSPRSAEEQARAIATIERNALAQARLIDDVLDVSRIVTGKVKLDVRLSQVTDFVDSAVNAARPVAEAKGVALSLSYEGDPGLISGDADRLQQVVSNLVTNAVKFTPARGHVTVSVRTLDGSLQIEVRDDGVGIPPEVLPHVFERFFQAERGHTRTYRGLGLGLAIVKSLVELHGGSVEAHSEGAGKGARFVVGLPAARASLPALAMGDARSGSGRTELGGVRVLVVDDEDDSRSLIQMVLELKGAAVETAGSVSQGIVALERFQPHVLVSDIGMPYVDGYAFIRSVRTGGGPCARIPAIALTAFARKEDRDAAIDAGFNRHLTKPADVEALVVAIGELAAAAGCA